jgi:ABC-type Mn2+/Zn2+ transport system ATPase subunit
MDKSIRIENLSFSFYRNVGKQGLFNFFNIYKSNSRVVIDDINLEFLEGSYTLITGNNGSGKSSLISVINYENIFKKNFFNAIIFKESYMKRIKGDVVYINEEKGIESGIYSINNFPVCNAIVNDFVSVFRGVKKEKDRELQNEVNKTGFEFHSNLKFYNEKKLNELYQHFNYESKIQNLRLNQMSEGQLNLTYLIKTLLKDTFFYIFDEPLNALDNNKTKQFNDYLIHLTKHQSKSVLVISHCFNNLTPDYSRVYSLDRVIETENSEEIYNLNKMDNFPFSLQCICMSSHNNP